MLRYNIGGSACGSFSAYGKRIYISPSLSQDVLGLVGGTKGSGEGQDGHCQSGNAKAEHDREERVKRRLLQLERSHKESMQDKDDTILNLRELISEHERKLFELETNTDGNRNAQNLPPSASYRHPTPTQKLLDQIEKLQKEKEILLLKVAEYECTESSSDLRLSGDFDVTSQMGSCTTDTEKELMLIKRDKHYLDREITKLRQENKQLREMLVKCGFDVSLVIPSGQLGQDDILKSSGEKGFGISGSGSSPMSQLLSSQDMENKVNKDQEIAILRGKFKKLGQNAMVVDHDFVDVKTAYLALKAEVKVITGSFGMVIAEMQREIQLALADINAQNKDLVDKYLREMKLRKKYHNELVDLRGNIRVLCRVRPPIKEDGTEEDGIVVTLDTNDDSLVTINNKGRNQFFDVDKAFGMNSTQSQVFEEVSALVRSVIDGYNVCIFAYGQTGSGKTFTMEGPRSDPGINQRALQLLFEETRDSEWEYEISASVMEIYNETLRDLLNMDASNKLEVRMRSEGGLYVPGLVTVPVSKLDEVNKLFETGRKNRATASTNMNEHSSRSHCLLCVTVRGQNPTTGSKSLGRLNLVDLAGSERVSKSMADGTRLKEAQNINKSLACLGDVIHALRNKHGHVPYRNSKLTYLLQDSLGGDSKTLMIVQVSPVEKNINETVCTLTFGQRVRNVELGSATKNVDLNKSLQASLGRQLSVKTSFSTPSSPSATSPLLSPSASSPFISSLLPHGSPLTSSTPQLSSRKKTPSTLRPPALTASSSSPQLTGSKKVSLPLNKQTTSPITPQSPTLTSKRPGTLSSPLTMSPNKTNQMHRLIRSTVAPRNFKHERT
ncbi:unnamed protein product [Lymnaea stagnalis]|uniref:Kinesin-like protein n=1 Tax=Lymnaea stagnalis TaxID=6523 RepID=A0AAV2HIB1_LYMST